jgi:uncharacterized Zn-finger protein
MQPSQQPHSPSHGYYSHSSNMSGSNPYNNPTTPSYGSISRSSSFSSSVGYQPLYGTPDEQRQQHYGQQNVYDQDVPQNYTSNVHGQYPHAPPFLQTAQRSTSDRVTYMQGQDEVRRSSHLLQPGPIRGRTVSLSYARVHEPTGTPPSPYPSQLYSRDTRISGVSQPHPPTAYRPGMAGSPIQSQPSAAVHNSRPVLARLDTGGSYQPEYQTRRSSVSSQSSTHIRREIPVSSTSQPYQQGAPPSPSSSGTQPRPHICDNCGLAFVRGHDLKRHKDTHSNAKPHICECGKSFSRKDALKRHVFLKSCRGEKNASGYATSED